MKQADKIHYIAMSGMRGYMPDYCDVSFDRSVAVGSLVNLHELGRTHKTELNQNSFLLLKADYSGAEYCEINECSCNEPWNHSDMSEEDFKREFADELAEESVDEL